LISDATLQTISAIEWDIQLIFLAEGSRKRVETCDVLVNKSVKKGEDGNLLFMKS